MLLPFSFGIGRYGVDIFFILSGFVVFLSLERQPSIISFYKSRFVRLFPIFWFCVLFSSFIIIGFNIESTKLSLPILLANLTMIPRQLIGINSYIEGSYWTLECELFFYILISLVYFKVGKKYTIFVFLFITCLALIIHLFDITSNPFGWTRIVYALFMRLYGILNIKYVNLFLCGMSLYLYRKYKKSLYYVIFIFSILCSFFYTPDGHIAEVENGKIINGFIVLLIGLFLWFSYSPLLKSILCNNLLLLLGEISYPLYLIHCNLGRVITKIVSNSTYSTALGLFSGFICVILVSTFLTFKVDIPLRKFLQKKLL